MIVLMMMVHVLERNIDQSFQLIEYLIVINPKHVCFLPSELVLRTCNICSPDDFVIIQLMEKWNEDFQKGVVK